MRAQGEFNRLFEESTACGGGTEPDQPPFANTEELKGPQVPKAPADASESIGKRPLAPSGRFDGNKRSNPISAGTVQDETGRIAPYFNRS